MASLPPGRRKSQARPAEFIFVMLAVIFISAIVVAQSSQRIVVETKDITVFAGTKLAVSADSGELSIITASLLRDDGSPVENALVEFYLRGEQAGVGFTDNSGIAKLETNKAISEDDVVRAVFAGDGDAYLNPSEAGLHDGTSIRQGKNDAAVDGKPGIRIIGRGSYSPGEPLEVGIETIGGAQPSQTAAYITGPDGVEKRLEVESTGSIGIASMETGRLVRPGIYKIMAISSFDSSGDAVAEANISIGLLNINTNKSIYRPGETALVIVGMIDAGGSPVAGANLSVSVEAPSSAISIFSTAGGSIGDNLDGTYALEYPVKELGTHGIHAVAYDQGTPIEYSTSFDSRSFVEFDIIRDAPTVIKLQDTRVAINITANTAASDATFTEYVPSEFNVTTDGIVADNGSVKTITWYLGDLQEGDSTTVNYVFTPPQVSPALYLLGPGRVDYNSVQSFSEGRAWTIAADAAFFYYVKWAWYWNGTGNVTDELTLCSNQTYNVSIAHYDLAHDSDSTSQTVRLQIKPEDEAVYQSLPYAGFQYWNGQSNDVTLASELGNDNVDCQNGQIDHCYLANRSVNISSTAATKKYKLKYTSQQFPGRFLDSSNIIDIRVINCTDVNLIRDIKIFSPSGEDGYVVRGHRASMAVPVANYNPSQQLSGNVTVTLLDGTTELGWFFLDNKTRLFTLMNSSVQPSYNENVLFWSFDVPDNATQKTYTARVTIRHNGTGISEINYTEDFTLQDSGDGTSQPIIIYTAPAFVTPCDGGAASGEHFRLQVCNYGDYNLTVNITTFLTGKSGLFNATIVEGQSPNSIDSDTITWNNRDIPTSTCFLSTAEVFGPEDINVGGSYLTDVVWIDPVTGSQQGVSKADNTGTCGGAANNAHGASPNPFFNITSVVSGQAVSINFSERSASSDAGESVYLVDLIIPPGFNVTRSSFSVAPEPGYPIGSFYEGYRVRWAFSPTPLTMTQTINGTTLISNISGNVGAIGNFTPGGKVFYQSLVGQSSVNKGQWWSKQRATVQVNGTWLKTTRKYFNETEGLWKEYDFPTALSCGTVNVSLEVFNKGNTNATRFNVTEIYPSGVVLQGFSPANTSGTSTLVLWDGGRNFNTTGRLNASFFNYTINLTPVLPVGKTDTFQANHTNGTYIFTDRQYAPFLACGAALTVADITGPSSANQSVNISLSTVITNNGPGTASNVTALINATSNFTMYNSTGQASNITYFGNIQNGSTAIANWTVNTSVACGSTYTFWIMVNSTENATSVVKSNQVQVLCPSKSISLDVPKANSTETGVAEGGWGFNFTFNITVDSDADANVTVSAWRSTDQSAWTLIGDNNFTISDSQKNFSFAWDPQSPDIGTWFYKFNATDGGGNTNTTATRTLTVSKENTTITYFTGHASIANRSGNQTSQLGFIIADKNGTNLSSFPLKFSITTNNVTYYSDSRYVAVTNGTGHALFSFNATCANEYSGAPRFQVGEQQWKINLNDSVTGIYNDNDTSAYLLRNLSVRGNMRINVTDPTGSSNFTQRDAIDTIGTAFDDCDLELGGVSVNYTYNYSNTLYNCTAITSPVTGLYRCSWDSAVGLAGFYNASMAVNLSDYYDNFTLKTRTGEPYLFFLSIFKSLINITTTPPTDGWGRRNWNFTAFGTSGNATPTFNVNFSMKTGAGSFTDCISGPLSSCTNITPTTCSGCTNQQFSFIRNFTSGQQGTWFLQFSLNDTSTSGTDTVIVEKDDVNISARAGNNSIINRSGGQTGLLSVLVYDTDAGSDISTPSVTVGFNITNNTMTFLKSGENTTNSSGVGELYFNPNCSFNVSTQYYVAHTSSDSNYKDNVSANFTVSINGDLAPGITNPTGQSFTVGDNVTVNVTVIGDCSESISSSALNITLTSVNDLTNFTCGNLTALGDGNYSCAWNSTAASTGFYNITVRAYNVSSYNNGSTSNASAFRLLAPNNTAPVYFGRFISPQVGGFGEMFNFTVEVRDLESDDLNVTFYLSPDNSTFTLIESKTCVSCGATTNVTFNYTAFQCANISQQYFRFNLSDGQLTNQTPSASFTVEKDDTTAYLVQGNASEVNRTGGSVLLVLRINDTDKGTNVSSGVNATIWVTFNTTAFNSGNFTTTNSSGHFNLSFDPTCAYEVGSQAWRGGASNDACYKDANSTNMTLTIIGTLNNTLRMPLGGQKFQNNENVTFLGDVTNDCSVFITGATVYFLSRHDSMANITTSVDIANGSYNGTLNATTLPGGYFNVTFNSTRTNYNNGNTTANNTFFHQISPNLTNATSNISSGPWGTTFQFTVNVTDDDDNVTIRLWDSPDNVTFTLRGTQTCSDCQNTTVTFTRTYSLCADIDETWYWKINATDSSNLSNQTSVSTINITRRDVNFVLQAGNNTNVSRVGSNTTTLTVRIRDALTGSDIGSGFDGAFFATVNGSNWARVTGATTDPNSDISTNFNPSCGSPRYYVGNQKWTSEFRDTGTNNCYFAANSSNFTLQIQSFMTANVTNPNGEAYQRGSSIAISGDAIDADSACEQITGATAIYKIIQGGTTNSCSPEPASDQNNGTYNCSWDSSSQSLGFWNITMNTTASFYNSTFITKTNALQLRERPQLTTNNVNVTTAGWGESITLNLTVKDPDSGDTVNVSLWRSFDSVSYTLVDWQTCTACTSETALNFYKQFACTDFTSGPLIYFKFNATDTFGLTNETTVKNWTTERDDVAVALAAGSGISINREGSPTGLFSVRIQDTDNGSFLAGGVNGTIWVTTNGVAFDDGNRSQTNSTGHINFNFDPTCSYSAGTQLWRGGSDNDACYKAVNLSPSQSFTVLGQLKTNLLQPAANSNFNVTNQILTNFTIQTDCSVDGNLTGVTNLVDHVHQAGLTFACSPVAESNAHYTCTLNSTGKPEGNYSINITSTQTSYNSNTTNYSFRYFLDNLAPTNFSAGSVSPGSGGWSRDYNYTIPVNDTENDTITCTLYVSTDNGATNRTIGSTNVIGGNGTCRINATDFQPSDIGTDNIFFFQINDSTSANAFNTSRFSGPDLTISNVTVTLTAGNASQINRSASSIPLIVRIFDTGNQSFDPGINVTFHITYNQSQFNITNLTQTNSTGHAAFNFNPNCSFTAATQFWLAGTTDANYNQTNTTTNFTMTVFGDLVLNVTNPFNIFEILRSGNISLNGSILSDCSAQETIADATVQFSSVQNTTSVVCSSTTNLGSGNYSCIQNTSSLLVR
ncbi:MAG: hypothetical protein HY367_02155, partial [Candidatus Aenigmarchaeota archaeon]|nr:hypothetical protein [Candidatus Aenigmarchaeota archaeon]